MLVCARLISDDLRPAEDLRMIENLIETRVP